MAWLVIHARQRKHLLAGARDGAAEFTRDSKQAMRFDNQDRARKWIERNVVSAFGELALMREAGERDTRKGTASHYGRRASNP